MLLNVYSPSRRETGANDPFSDLPPSPSPRLAISSEINQIYHNEIDPRCPYSVSRVCVWPKNQKKKKRKMIASLSFTCSTSIVMAGRKRCRCSLVCCFAISLCHQHPFHLRRRHRRPSARPVLSCRRVCCPHRTAAPLPSVRNPRRSRCRTAKEKGHLEG